MKVDEPIAEKGSGNGLVLEGEAAHEALETQDGFGIAFLSGRRENFKP